MKIDKSSKLELCAAKVDARYAMRNLYLETDGPNGPRLCATNGCTLAVVPVELEDGDEAGLVSVDALKIARQGAGHGKARIECNKSLRAWGKNGPLTFERPSDGNFPDIRATDLLSTEEAPEGLKICLNAKLLYNLARALGEDEIALTIPTDKGKPLFVRGLNQAIPDAVGLLMPISG